jgi:hypothetical protein
MGEEIDRYFKELEEGIKDPECDINGFEKIMKNNQERNVIIIMMNVVKIGLMKAHRPQRAGGLSAHQSSGLPDSSGGAASCRSATLSAVAAVSIITDSAKGI